MPKQHGTASEGRVVEFALTVARNAPRDLPLEVMDAWDGKGNEMKVRLREALVTGPPTILPYPKVGEIFELALDGDLPENQPFEMVRRSGRNPNGWRQRDGRLKGKGSAVLWD